MHFFCTFTQPFSVLSRPSLVQYVFRQISSKFSPLGMMGKSRNSPESSRAEGFSAGSSSAICKDPVRATHHGPQLSDDNEGFMVGSILISLRKRTAPYGMHCFTSSSESNSLSPAERLPAVNITSHHDQSSFPSNSWKKSRVSYTKRPHSAHCNLNYVEAGHMLDSSKIEPFDICLPERQNSGLLDVTEDSVLRPGMVLLKHFITHHEQVKLVKICCKLGLGPGGFYQPGYEGGAKLRLQMMCLGLDWDPQTKKYGKRRSIDGSNPPSIPPELRVLVKRAIQEAHYLIKEESGVSNVEDLLPSMSPDICIVNFYTANGRLGLHQDRDESRESLRKGLPVVSFSVGDSAEFLYGDQRDVEKAAKVLLESGDVLIFGGEARHVFHGVSSIIPNSAPKLLLEDTRLRPGRLNLTFRQF